MANNFNIVISATDKATSSVRKVNDSISKMMRPITNVQRSMKSLGAELGRNPVVRGLGKIERVAQGVAISMARVAAPMVGITGIASVAGVAALATQWGRLGFEVSKTAANVGVSVTDLQSLRGAAKLAGVGTEELTGGLKTLGDTLQDAAYNRNGTALEMMRILGLRMHRTADGAVDTTRAFMDLADVISSPKFKGNAQLQGLIARTFGQDGNLPLLRKGSAGIREYQAAVASLGGIQSQAGIEAAEKFGLNLNRLGIAADGLRISIGNSLLPVMNPLIEKMTKWVSLNREPIGKAIGDWADKFGAWLTNLKQEDWNKVEENIKSVGSAILSVAEGINAATDAWNRWSNKDKVETPGVTKKGWFKFGKSNDLDEDAIRNGRKPLGGRMSGGKITGLAPIGIRNNNPGNLRQWKAMPTVGGFAVFPNPSAGIEAMGKQLQLYGGRGIDTIRGIVSTWAPPSENNTDSYISAVAKETGFAPDQKLNLSDSRTLAPLISAMIKQENGQNPYSKDMIEGALSAKHEFTMKIEGLPAGATASISNQSGESIPVRVVSPMPSFGG